MTRPKLSGCECSRMPSEIVFRENISGIDEWPYSWPAGEVSYRLNNHSSDFETPLQHRAVTVAFRVWQWRIQNLKFRRERNRTANVDFEISFQPTSKFSSRNVLAHAYFPNQGAISGDIEINDDDWEWTTNIHESSVSRPPLTSVMIHELGHSLGLRHSNQNDSIMYPSLNLGAPSVSLSGEDIQRIQSRYGSRTVSQRLLDYFSLRILRGWDFD